jgi:glycolate oxidase iron-sulfur subunit
MTTEHLIPQSAVRSPQSRAGFAGPDVPDFDILNTCVQCGLCLPSCPTYRENYREQSSPRGRLHLMRSVYESKLDVLDPVFVAQMSECLDCRACEAVCPSGVKYGAVLEASRTQVQRARQERGLPSVQERVLRRFIFGWLFRDLRRLRAAAMLLRLYQTSGLQRLARGSGMLRLLGMERMEAQLPDLRRAFFVPRWQVYPAQGERRGQAGLLAGCVMSTAYAHVDRATIRVLTRNGWDVIVPERQGCCGALHAHAGEIETGRALMRRNIAAFQDVDVIVSNAAGCGAALKEYSHLLKDDPIWAERAAAFSAKARDVTELLVSAPDLRLPDLGPRTSDSGLRVTYQEPCHLAHAQRITEAPRTLLRAIPGVKLVEMAESSMCCGSAGIYGITQPEMSVRLQEHKLGHALATEADVIVTANPGCAMQLEAGLRARGSPVKVRHIIELLDAAYRRGTTDEHG